MSILMLIISIIGIIVVVYVDKQLRIVSINDLIQDTYNIEQYLDQQKILLYHENPESKNILRAELAIVCTRKMLIKNKQNGQEYCIIKRIKSK